jgi:glycosyltransferase involved in cell wall biosynthesis
MATDRPLIIGYAGSLSWSDGKATRFNVSLKDYFWTYRHNVTDPSTRSAYFLFRALAAVKRKYGVNAQQLQVHLWGNIDKRNSTQASEMGVADLVKISGYLGKKESLSRTEQCDVLFLPMESPTDYGNPLFIPGKAYEYMAMRKPILALAKPCDCIDILSPSGLMIRFDPADETGIADWLHAVIVDRSKLLVQPDSAYIEQYSFKNVTAKVADVFDELLDRKPF